MMLLLRPNGFTDTDERITQILSSSHVSQALSQVEFASSS